MLRSSRLTLLASSLGMLVVVAPFVVRTRAEGPKPGGPFDGLAFREIGPATPSGRIDDFAVLESNPSVFYVAAATGGVWKTVNRGTTFEPVFDHESTASVGDIAIAPNDANLVWVGTGENNNRQSSSWGDGVFKSTDGGRTWTNAGLRDSRHVARILVDPVDHEIVYVAALGSLWGDGGDRGVFKTVDGGLTWSNVLRTDADTGATELVMDPANNKVLYAATYQRRRASWGFNGGGDGSAIYKTTDAGRSWTKLTTGIPEGPKGRIGLDIYRRNPNVIYARIEHEQEAGVYRSDDAGASWQKLSSLNPRPMYFSQIRVDPQSDSRVYVLGVQLHVSDDGGKTFHSEGARSVHVDFHAMWIDPANPDYLLLGGDGGVAVSYDRSRTWLWFDNLNLAQLYHASYDMQTPYTVCGGLQDNNTWCGPSAVRNKDGIGNDEWFIIGGGDGFVGLVDPIDPRIMYAESQDGRMNRVDRVTNERKAIRPEPAEDQPAYRWNWDTPMALSPHDPATVFVAANKVFRSHDRGHSWTAVSPDLTDAIDRDDRELMGVKGKDITIARNDGVSAHGTIVTFAESALEPGVYYTGSDDGVVAVTKDAGTTWVRVSDALPGVPPQTWVSEVVPSRFAKGTVYATFDGHRLNDFGTYVLSSPDYGATWRSIVGDLPKGEVVRTLTEDLKNPDVLYIGTETGLFVTTDRGRSWVRVKANLPTVPVYEITLHPRDNDLILATHGRGLWILDDLSPFQNHAEAAAASVYVFPPEAAVQRNPSAERMREFEGDQRFLGANPPNGVSITYRLGTAAKDVSVVIRGADGTTVRELKGDDVKSKNAPGLNTVVWDLRVEPLPRPKSQSQGSSGFLGRSLDGPRVLPGTYSGVLVVDGQEVGSRSLEVLGDPDIAISNGDRRTHFDTVLALHELQRHANLAYDAVTTLNEQVATIKKRLSEVSVSEDVKAAVDAYEKELSKVKPRFGVGVTGFGGRQMTQNVRLRVGMLKGQVMGSTSLPTTTQTDQVDVVRKALASAIDEVNAVIAGASTLYQTLVTTNVLMDIPAPIPASGR